MANCKENERKTTTLANCLWGGALAKGQREWRECGAWNRAGAEAEAEAETGARHGRWGKPATWQFLCQRLEHNLNYSLAICHTLYGILCHTIGHTICHTMCHTMCHIVYHTICLAIYIEQTGKSKCSSAQRQQLCNLSGFHFPKLLHNPFLYPPPKSFSLPLPLSSLLLHPLNSVYNLFCKFFNCFSNCLRQNVREIQFLFFCSKIIFNYANCLSCECVCVLCMCVCKFQFWVSYVYLSWQKETREANLI